MSTIVALGRLLDGAVMGAFVMLLSGFALHAFAAFYQLVVVTEKSKFGVFSMFLSRAFPFKNDKFDYNLMHILLFAILTAIMSMAHHRHIEKKARKEEEEEKRKKNQ
jgi:multisubunit Na+/H+ antiporter MnhG subunit